MAVSALMPTLTPAYNDRAADFNSLIADHVASLELSLAQGCERIAKERETDLREANKQLQQENQELRLCLDRATASGPTDKKKVAVTETAIVSSTTDNTIPDGTRTDSTDARPADSTDGYDAAPSKKTSRLMREGTTETLKRGTVIEFNLFPEYLSQIWAEHDQDNLGDEGFVHREEPEFETIVRKPCVVDPSSEFRLAWDILGIPILSWDLITIPLGVFTIGTLGDEIMEGAGWVTLIYWTVDLPFTFLTGFF